MEPTMQKQHRRNFILKAAALSALAELYCLHLGHLVVTQEPSPQLIVEAADHLLTHPLRIFPTDAGCAAYGLLAALVITGLLYTRYLREKKLRRGVESGSAAWNENRKEFAQEYTDLPLTGTGSPNMIMSQETYLSMDTRKTMRNNNVVVIGGSGTGKSRFLAKPNLLQANASFVVTDPSGELLESVGSFLEEDGYEIRVFNLADMQHSNRYNPFAYIRDENGVLTMITALIQNTTPPDAHKGDDFWVKAETALLESICFYIIEMLPTEDRHFSAVMDMLRLATAPEGQPSPLDALFALFENEHPGHIAAKSYAVYKSAGDTKTAQSIRVSCQVRLQQFNLSAVRWLTYNDNMHLEDIGDKKVALFCVTPTADSTYDYLVCMLHTQLFETLYHHAEQDCPGKRLAVPVRFILDEFANIGTIPDFDKKLSTMRKYEISCTIILQALSQLKTMYKNSWDVIMANCDSLIFLGSNDKTTTDYISDQLGKETIYSVNTSNSTGRGASSSTSYNTTGRELLTPAELRTMKNKNCIYILRGQPPFYDTKFQYEKHPNYPCTADADASKLYRIADRLDTQTGWRKEHKK